jgi:hypothetical protein
VTRRRRRVDDDLPESERQIIAEMEARAAADPDYAAALDEEWREIEARIEREAHKTPAMLHPHDLKAQRLAKPHYEALLRMLAIEAGQPKWFVAFSPCCCDERSRIRRDRGYIGQAGPPPRRPKMANPPLERGAQASDDKFGHAQQPEFNSAREFLHPLFSGNGFVCPRGRRR